MPVVSSPRFGLRTAADRDSNRQSGHRPASGTGSGPKVHDRTMNFYDSQAAEVEKILETRQKNPDSESQRRDRRIAQRLDWLCDNGSLPGRC
jgi:hypothetical protein